MNATEVRNMDTPDEVRPFVDKGHVQVVTIGGTTVGRAVYEPGWRWSEHVKPLAGTDSCEQSHLGYVISGRMRVALNDGSEADIGPGDVFAVPPGHDAWTVGEHPCVLVDFAGMAQYAKRPGPVSGIR